MLIAGNAERHRFGAGGEQDMAAFEHSCADGHRVATGEAGAAVVSIDALLSKARLPGLWHRLGEAALEAHKRRPIDIEAPMADALAVQPPRPISGLRGTDQEQNDEHTSDLQS